MNSIVKKTIVYSLVGIMQIGWGAAVTEASPLFTGSSQQRIIQVDRPHGDKDRQREHDERKRKENERHEKEMRRRPHESEREWRQRQERENKRHEQALREIAAFLLGVAVGNSN
ncbi:hypothetical protein P22_1433 [Propionispora sp. 2/2-37]|uniref:hypothetical protein n=1 Tax=Propionispora sp. 2/2-37 TaxID=1677858 RepID=UPI0006BB887E|nr:hypothetical protein [Propionispora sp. 2/2-37]CUH95363.1 hypothetical protein P22_1433 [Propionispora sp. 2/2-37]